MKRLFTNALQQIHQQIGLHTSTTQELVKHIKQVLGHDLTYSQVNRLPLSEVKNMLKTPCPTSAPAEDEQGIAVFKRMRQNFGVKEHPVCLKCPRAAQCPFNFTTFKESSLKAPTGNKAVIHDILYYLIRLSRQSPSAYSDLRWSAAYKITTSLRILLKDYDSISKQALLFRQVFRNLNQEEEKELKKRQNSLVEQSMKTREALSKRRISLKPLQVE